MSGADEWRARFAQQRLSAEAQYRFERSMHYARIAALIEAEHAPREMANQPIVLEPGHEIDSGADGSGCPSAARRVESAALAAGWAVRTVRSVAALPRTGILRVVTVRGSRHDERFWAAWWNDAFERAWYVGPTGLERLGGDRMSLAPVAVTPVDQMTVPQIKSLAVDRGIHIPSKFKKAEVIEHVRAAGLTHSLPPPRVRGVMDAIEGLRLQ